MLSEPESMAQIHRIRERLYEEEKRLSARERIAKIHQDAEAILNTWNLTLKRVAAPVPGKK